MNNNLKIKIYITKGYIDVDEPHSNTILTKGLT
ncbi:hypothetical protein FHX96_002354 [Clostridium tetanomorphum]|nr:hypothetical protein [Clostridium tetanomorphum]NRZ97664.1 hypothetical protein [Clostridium tetanomorphum]